MGKSQPGGAKGGLFIKWKIFMASEVNNEETTPTAKGIPNEAISSPGRRSVARLFFVIVSFVKSVSFLFSLFSFL